jgi:hypothetical protein
VLLSSDKGLGAQLASLAPSPVRFLTGREAFGCWPDLSAESAQTAMRTRSQGLTAPVAQDLDRDLLLAAESVSDKVVQDLMKKYKAFIKYHPDLKLNAVRNQLLRQMGYPPVRDAVPSPPVPSPVPELPVGTSLRHPLAVVDAPSPVPDLSVGTSSVHDSCPPVGVEGSPDPLTQCDTQCSGCLTLQSDNARLQQAEQQASERILALESENQHLRSLSQHREVPQQPLWRDPAGNTAATVADTPVAESLAASVLRPPPPPVQVAKTLQVVVRGLRVKGNACPGLLLSALRSFCHDQLHLQGTLTMRAVKVFKTPPGTIAGVVALQSWQGLEALFRAKRQHLRADSFVSIEPNRTRAERLTCTIARRARRTRAPPSCQRPGAAEDRIDAAGHPHNMNSISFPTRSTLRADAPEFVPASAALCRHSALLSSVALPVPALHQE